MYLYSRSASASVTQASGHVPTHDADCQQKLVEVKNADLAVARATLEAHEHHRGRRSRAGSDTSRSAQRASNVASCPRAEPSDAPEVRRQRLPLARLSKAAFLAHIKATGLSRPGANSEPTLRIDKSGLASPMRAVLSPGHLPLPPGKSPNTGTSCGIKKKWRTGVEPDALSLLPNEETMTPPPIFCKPT